MSQLLPLQAPPAPPAPPAAAGGSPARYATKAGPSPRRRPRRAAIAMIALLAAAPAVVAQGGGGAGQPEQGQVEGPSRPRELQPIINITFRGGSIGDYLKAVKEAAAPTPVNVVVSDDVLRLKANPIELRGVSVETAVYLLAQGQVLTPEPLRVSPAGGGRDSAPVYLVESRQLVGRQLQQQPPTEPQRSVRVFSIRDLVEPAPASPGDLTIDPETLMSSIEAALSLHGESEARDVLFHPEAGILIVRAAGNELAVTTELLSEIRHDLESRRDSASQSSHERQALESEVRRLETQLRISQAETEYTQRRFAEAEKLVAQGGSTQAELEEARLEVMRAEARQQAVEQQFEAALRQLRAREGQAPAGDDRQSLLNEITRLKAEVAALRAELGRGGSGEGAGDPGGR